MENEIREQILKIAKKKGISFEEEVEIIRKGFVEQKKVDTYTNQTTLHHGYEADWDFCK